MSPAAQSAAVRPGAASARRLVLMVGCLAGIVVNCCLRLPYLPAILYGDNDFIGAYAGAQLAGTGHLYDAEAARRIEAPLSEVPRFLPWVRIPIYATMLSPLRFLSYRH